MFMQVTYKQNLIALIGLKWFMGDNFFSLTKNSYKRIRNVKTAWFWKVVECNPLLTGQNEGDKTEQAAE